MSKIPNLNEQQKLANPTKKAAIAPLLFKLFFDFPCNDSADAYCKLFYLVCKVRGSKHVMKQLPHDVELLEPCFSLLSRSVSNDILITHS